jgi:hypothetical protein
VCKYPLLFSELLKQTTVVDCANSHMEIENSLLRLREATAEINKATDDARVRTILEKTWLLQDRLVFPNQASLAEFPRSAHELTVFDCSDLMLSRRTAFDHLATSSFVARCTSVGRRKTASVASS